MRDDSAHSSSPRSPARREHRTQQLAVLIAGLLLCTGILVPTEYVQPRSTGSDIIDRCRIKSNERISVYHEFTHSDLMQFATPMQIDLLENRQIAIHSQHLLMGSCRGAVTFFVFRDEGTAERIGKKVRGISPFNIEYRIRRLGQVVVLFQAHPKCFSEMVDTVFEAIDQNCEKNGLNRN